MKKKLDRQDLATLIGQESKRLWGASFTVDEHEAFAMVFRALGGRTPNSGVHLSFQRSGFRRAGQGVIPRNWLQPFTPPHETPLPTYHPKLVLSENVDGYALAVSTGNFASDDFRKTSNLAVKLDLEVGDFEMVRQWIESRPHQHRALCLLEDRGGGRFFRPKANESTAAQFRKNLERCPACRRAGVRRGQWLVASPFWSPTALKLMLDWEPKGSVEAYFRSRALWEQVGLSASVLWPKVRFDQVQAFELRNAGKLDRWHHKVIAWRCCDSRSAKTALYLGSANATVCGFFGKAGRAVNWEAGVLWKGGPQLWEYARAIARLGLQAKELRFPEGEADNGINGEDDLGVLDSEEFERIFAFHVERCIRVFKGSREVTATHGKNSARVLGHQWRISRLELLAESGNDVRFVGLLRHGKRLKVQKGLRPQIHAVFLLDLPPDRHSNLSVPPRVDVSLDLVDLDPEPVEAKPTKQTSIQVALAGLGGRGWDGGGRGSGKRPPVNGHAGPVDVRFPFAEYQAFQGRRPAAAAMWLERVAASSEKALDLLPMYWREIARLLKEESSK
jgi:hypothetical protein